MSRRNELLTLADRLEGAEAKYDEAITRDLAKSISDENDVRFWQFWLGGEPMTSLDAAVALCERALPGWDYGWHSTGNAYVEKSKHFSGRGKNACLGLDAAICRALAAQEPQP